MKIQILNNIKSSIGLTPNSIGIAFSGGGAKGFSHVGVIMALEKFHIKPQIISGVSAGAIAAALYGSGLRASEIIERFAEYPKFLNFAEWSIPREGFFKLTRFKRLLKEWLPIENLEEMIIPTVICATDFDHGKSVGFSKGDIAERVVASCSIPVIFPPVEINGINYVDGGVLRNLPAWAIREKCKTLIGVNCSPLQPNYKYKKSLLDIALRSYSLMAKANTLQDLNICDYVIQNPRLSSYGIFDMKAMKKIILEGYDTACVVLEDVLKN